MDVEIFYAGGNVVKLLTSKPTDTQEVARLFAQFGEIKEIISRDDSQIIYFASEEDAKNCVQRYRCESSTRAANADPASTGDTIAKTQQCSSAKTKKSKKMLSKIMRQVSELTGALEDTVQHQPDFSDQYLPSCSSPVLLNTMDPGFRLAYCHDVQNLKPIDIKPGRLNRFSESIKKYMDNSPRFSTQELIVTNLPSGFKEEDVYKLCGNVRPEMIELKQTSNINVSVPALDALYASIKTKTKDDFETLTKIFGNRLIDGMKITSIPITKVENSSFGQFKVNK